MHSKQPPHDFRIGKQYIENTKKSYILAYINTFSELIIQKRCHK